MRETKRVRGRHAPPRLGPPFLAVALAVLAAGSPGRAADGAWRTAAVWDDGNAEYCAYEVDWSRYGTSYPGSALMILVKEPWAPDLDVKADRPRPDGFDVLKLNHLRDVPTGIYTYHQMASVFLRRDSGGLEKVSVTSHEGCGISTAHMVEGEINTRSYFDGQGEKTRPYPAGALTEDGLAAQLRDFLTGDPPSTIEVVPSFMAGYLPAPEAESYRLSRQTGQRRVPAGSYEVIEIGLQGPDRRLTYAFDRRPPHPLVHLEVSDGTEYRLAKCERIPYWTMNRPGDEEWLPASVR